MLKDVLVESVDGFRPEVAQQKQVYITLTIVFSLYPKISFIIVTVTVTVNSNSNNNNVILSGVLHQHYCWSSATP